MQITKSIFSGIILAVVITGCAPGSLIQKASDGLLPKRSNTAFGVVGPTHAQALKNSYPLQEKWWVDSRAPAEIQGEVFADENGNGQRDHDEPGIPKIRIVLPGSCLSHISDKQGEFSFGDLDPGQQAVSLDELTIPKGYHLTTDATIPIFLSEGARGYVKFGLQEDRVETGKEKGSGYIVNDKNMSLRAQRSNDNIWRQAYPTTSARSFLNKNGT